MASPSAVRRLSIRSKLTLAFVVVAATTVMASVIGFVSFFRIDQSLSQITQDSVPSMSLALSLAQQSAMLEHGLPTLATAATDAQRVQRLAQLKDSSLSLQHLTGIKIHDLSGYALIT